MSISQAQYYFQKHLSTVVAIVVFVLGVTATSYWLSFQKEQHISFLQKRFEGYSNRVQQQIELALNGELQRLHSLAEISKLAKLVDRSQFDLFSQVLFAGNTSLHGLYWVELVKKDQTDKLLEQLRIHGLKDVEIRQLESSKNPRVIENQLMAVVIHGYPFIRNRHLIGVDLFSLNSQRQALYLADFSQKSVAAHPEPLLSSSESNPLVAVYKSIRSKDREKLGYAGLLIDLNDLLKRVLKDSLLSGRLSLSMHTTGVNRNEFAEVGRENLVKDSALLIEEFYITFAGKNWVLNTEINLKYLPEYQGYKVESKKAWLIGLFLSLMLALISNLVLRYALQDAESKRLLAKKEQYYANIINRSSEAYFLWDCHGRVLDVNDEACSLLGYRKERLLKMKLADFDIKFSKRDLQNVCGSFGRVKKRIFESIYKDSHGAEINVEVNAALHQIEDRDVLVAFVRDLTERQRSQTLSINNLALHKSIERYNQELSEQRRVFELLFEKSPDGIALVSISDMEIIDINPAAISLFGYKSQEYFKPLSLLDLAPKYQPDGTSSIRKALKMFRLCEQNGSHHVEWLNRHVNGTLFWTDVVLTLLKYYGKEVVHIDFRDITERKRLESEMLSAREEAVSANRVKSDFLAKMSHEIRTPLHGILTYAQMGEIKVGDLSPEKTKRYFENINLSGERLLSLVRDFQDMVSIEAGSLKFHFNYQNLQSVINTCVEQQPFANQKNIVIKFANTDYMAYFDKNRISQVILNLLTNSIRHTPNEGEIEILVTALDDSKIKVCLLDSGPGVEDEEKEKIFDMFQQGKKTSAPSGASGLGLAISREIIEAHQGKIWVENRVINNCIQGAAFCFTLQANRTNMDAKKSIS